MNRNSNTYTIVYSTILVVIVAAVLAFVSVKLGPTQQAHIDNEKKAALLAAVGVNVEDSQVSKTFDQVVNDAFLVDEAGNKVEGDAFKTDLKTQYDNMRLGKPFVLPVYECTLANGTQVVLLSAYGAGLWGPIWGYISLEKDLETIHGVSFAHQGETPGLGAEIVNPKFMAKFAGKKAIKAGACVFSVVKGEVKDESCQVDGITGATLTSRGLSDMIGSWFEKYIPYLNKCKVEE